MYATTIHAINSIVVKLSRRTKIRPLYRGWTGATLPKSFFTADSMGLRGGVEFGFSSTTTEREQAVHYAQGKASTILELEMGMVDRGADMSWLSQAPDCPPAPRPHPCPTRLAPLAPPSSPPPRPTRLGPISPHPPPLHSVRSIRTSRRRCCRR